MILADPLLLAVVLAVTIVLIIGNLYFIAHFSHHADNSIGSSTACKFVVMLAFMIGESQILILALDVVNFREQSNLDLYIFWQIVYMSSLFMTMVIIPFAYFFYETDEDFDFKTRFCTAFRNELIFFCVMSLIHFPMFAKMRNANFPVMKYTYDIGVEGQDTRSHPNFNLTFLEMEDSRNTKPEQEGSYTFVEATYPKQLTFPMYTIGAGAFWGQFLLVFFMGTGLVSIPFGFITAWADRPRPMDESKFKQEKDMLAKQVDYMLKDGKKIYEEKLKLDAQKL
mmetsp:Transcript_14819/g.25201  ORF Transcript_14819/g.25201 Transcript_14819/m.25201 type:complete len:282 (-) Transcript_14819:35-880(-)